ncbi:DNA cytosine methyltransferase [Halobacillus litoralis]|uniref:DNA cytosine methyltransferase n=1 Tax=Halobacillus litoralis TaxID=45668 RepID=UPI001CFDD339|nr:DNA cytosine methyltransferase [Halobacillus litoralis]WLR46557.1 DNA cytosine methyltransferase [Halobacillus litoralis]
MSKYAIDLFCGAGGMSEGLIQSGFHILFSSDINEDVERTYTRRHHQLGLEQGVNTYFQRADISELTGENILGSIQRLSIFRGRDIPEIDAIFGGPPCQGFSLAGRRNRNDPRNMLFREYVRVISEIEPKYVVMENVEGFLNTRLDGFIGLQGDVYANNSLVTEILYSELNAIGYTVLPTRVMDAAHFGVPQRRRRAIFLAYKNDETPPEYPLGNEEQITVAEAISDLRDEGDLFPQSNYQLMSREGRTPTIIEASADDIIFGDPLNNFNDFNNHEISKHSSIVQERLSLFNEGESTVALIKRIQLQGLSNISKNYPNLTNFSFKKQSNYQTIEKMEEAFRDGSVPVDILKIFLSKKSNRYRLDRESVSPTVVTLPDDYIVPFDNRIPTVRELARLQSFDDSFRFLGKRTTGGPRRRVEVPQYTQVGNAVPPLLAKAIADQIMIALNHENINNGHLTNI